MTENSWPFENADTSEAQYSYLVRQFADTGVLGTSGTTELKPYADSSGMFVRLPPGFAVINGYLYYNDDVKVLTVAQSGSSARTDTVVLQLSPRDNRILAMIKTGTTALTQTDNDIYEIALGEIAVGASATTIAPSNIIDRRGFSSSPWGKWTNNTRPSAPAEGKAGYNFSSKTAEFWDGSNWRAIATGGTTNASALTSGILPTARLDYGVLAAARGDRSMDAPVDQYGQINGDWNAILQPGAYRIYSGNNNQNAPAGAYMFGTLFVFGAGNTLASRTQMYCSHSSNRVYVRTAWNGNDWTGWSLLAVSGDIDNLQNQINNRYTKGEIDNAFSGRDSSIGGANANANSRTYNQANSSRMAAGNALVSNFASTGYGGTSAYSGYVDVTWPGLSLIAAIATAQSGDDGGVTATTTNLSNGGCRIVVVRRNNVATGVSWLAVGN